MNSTAQIPTDAKAKVDESREWFWIAEMLRAEARARDAIAEITEPRTEYKTLANAVATRLQQRYRQMADDLREVADHAEQVGRDLQAQALWPERMEALRTATTATTVRGQGHCSHCSPDCSEVHLVRCPGDVA